MFRSLLFSGLAAVFVVGVVSLVPAGGSAAMAQSPGQQRPGAAPPGTHGVHGTPPVLRSEEIEKRISPEEREKLGLPEATWVAQHGKVHPDVQEVLETGQMPWLRFKGWAPIGFQGTAYVAVYLRQEPKGKHASKESQAAIKEVQRRILSKLTAAEFSVVHAFKDTAAILGYVNSAGLGKLAQDADVIAVGLDDKPVPEDPPPARHEKHGPAERRGKVEVAVYDALEKGGDGYVFVGVNLEQVQRNEPALEAERAAVKALYERVLSGLSAEEFRVRVRGLSPHLRGYVNAAGVAKLANHPEVVGVGLSQPLIPPPRDMKKKWTP